MGMVWVYGSGHGARVSHMGFPWRNPQPSQMHPQECRWETCNIRFCHNQDQLFTKTKPEKKSWWPQNHGVVNGQNPTKNHQLILYIDQTSEKWPWKSAVSASQPIIISRINWWVKLQNNPQETANGKFPLAWKCLESQTSPPNTKNVTLNHNKQSSEWIIVSGSVVRISPKPFYPLLVILRSWPLLRWLSDTWPELGCLFVTPPKVTATRSTWEKTCLVAPTPPQAFARTA